MFGCQLTGRTWAAAAARQRGIISNLGCSSLPMTSSTLMEGGWPFEDLEKNGKKCACLKARRH